MKKEKLQYLKILLFFPLLICLVYVNVVGDASNYFHDINKDIAKSLLSGKAAGSNTGNDNEREIKAFLIQGMKKEVDTIAIGPSLVTYIGREAVGTESFYNLGVTNGDHYDMMAQFALLMENKINYKKVILTIDPAYFTDESYVTENVLHDALMPYSDYMVNFLKEKTKATLESSVKTNNFKKWRNSPVFSISYFQASWPFIFNREENRLLDISSNPTALYYEPDGSRHPSVSMDYATETDVIQSALNYNFQSLDCKIFPERQQEFELLLDYLLKNGKEVEFWYCPLSPALWDNIDRAEYPIFDQLEEYTLSLAEKKGIKTVGTYNPYKLGMDNSCFYDARHLKRKIIPEYFMFANAE